MSTWQPEWSQNGQNPQDTNGHTENGEKLLKKDILKYKHLYLRSVCMYFCITVMFESSYYFKALHYDSCNENLYF